MAGVWESLTSEQQEALAEAAKPLWAALEVHGFVDGHGGSEFERVFPETVDFVHAQANPSLDDVLRTVS
jgi:hypothetical protein